MAGGTAACRAGGHVGACTEDGPGGAAAGARAVALVQPEHAACMGPGLLCRWGGTHTRGPCSHPPLRGLVGHAGAPSTLFWRGLRLTFLTDYPVILCVFLTHILLSFWLAESTGL
jgi:hypothetical protein